MLGLTGVAAADPALPPSGLPIGPEIRIEAEELEERRARLHACWEDAQGESAGSYWRASLDDQKLNLKLGSTQQVGPVQGSYVLEQEWLDELQARRAELAVRIPHQGWEVGVSSNLDWQSQGEDAWELQPPLVSGWVQSPAWKGWTARASWVQQDELTTSRLALQGPTRQVEAEVAQAPDHRCVIGRVSQRFGRSTVALEAEQRIHVTPGGSLDLPETTYWQRRWMARYQWDLGGDTRISAEGTRRWSEFDYENRVEAKMELRF